MAEAQLDGVTLAWQQMGEGPDLVFVHGLAASRAFWFLQYAMPLSRRFRVTLFDLRGHGYSSTPATGYDATTMAADLAGLLDQLGIERCLLVGHSYGGGVALEFAATHPARVARLAILDTKVNALQPTQRLSDSPHLSLFEVEVARTSGHDWDNEPQVGLLFLEVLARGKLAGSTGETEMAGRDPFTPFGEGRAAVRTARQFVELLDTTAAREQFVAPGVPAEVIARLPMPLLLVYGEWSRCMPSCRALQALLPQAQLHIVPQAGHFFPASHAPMVMAWLAAFLDSEQGAREAVSAG
jgi:pimeloyl-ACP methyl ester carboxylesterase